jgi:hypothetical protein
VEFLHEYRNTVNMYRIVVNMGDLRTVQHCLETRVRKARLALKSIFGAAGADAPTGRRKGGKMKDEPDRQKLTSPIGRRVIGSAANAGAPRIPPPVE